MLLQDWLPSNWGWCGRAAVCVCACVCEGGGCGRASGFTKIVHNIYVFATGYLAAPPVALNHNNKVTIGFVIHKNLQQGKSEGFESCDRPIVRKRPIRVKSGDVLSRVTLKFDGWLWKTIGHLSFAVSSFVQHFITISEFKLELLSRNAQFR